MYLNLAGDALRVALVKVRPPVSELNLGHEGSDNGVFEGRWGVVVRKQHVLFPVGLDALVLEEFVVLESVSKGGGDDEGHGVVGGLTGFGVFLGWVPDDAECWFVSFDDDLLNFLRIASLDNFMVLFQKFGKALEGSSALVLIKSHLKVHTHD